MLCPKCGSEMIDSFTKYTDLICSSNSKTIKFNHCDKCGYGIKEEWEDIRNYEGYYQISNRGNIKSYHKNKNGKLMKITIQKTKYNYVYSIVGLTKDNQCVLFKVSRLVALHFIPNPENKPEVNHINNDSLNNYYKNLEWATHKENMQHSYNQSRLGKLKKSDWIIIKYLYENDIFQKELANYFNISASSIKEILVKMNVRIKTQTEIRHLQYHTPNRKTVESLLADLEVKE